MKRRKFNILQSPYDKRTFLIEEYRSLRSEISLHNTERHKIETQVFIGVFIFLGWLVVNEDKLAGAYERLAFGLPMMIVFLGFLRWAAIQSRTMVIGSYIRTIEPILRLDKNGGWEEFLTEERKREPILRNPQGWTEALGWILLGATTFAVYAYRYIL